MAEQAPMTLEGWYALHQVFAIDWAELRRMEGERARVAADAASVLSGIAAPAAAGWSAPFRVVGGGADLMIVHFRESLDELADAELRLRRSAIGPLLRLEYEYLSVTEAGLYHATAEAAEQARPGSPEFQRLLDEAAAAELASPHVRSRLFPAIPDGMRYISFYPMSRRRTHPDNWYMLPLQERSRLMREHGLSARAFAGRVFQVICGSLGLDDWEWGVTLFARDPLEFKRIVTDMRYDEASARYSEFGTFYTGVRVTAEEVAEIIAAG
ncbi:MAG TPA: hydrogen peroxide-dependent heme synthase [Longimicrobiales bacterium]